MHEMGMMEHIAAHSLVVLQVALCLSDRLSTEGNRLDLDLIQSAALLHDITKTRSFDTGENHAETAEAFLSEAGYPKVGRVVGQHVRLDVYGEDGPISEAEIVNYADKRVRHDQVVPLDARFDYIAQRYAKTPEDHQRIRFLRQRTAEVGKRIFSHLPFGPDALASHLDTALLAANLQAYRCFGS